MPIVGVAVCICDVGYRGVAKMRSAARSRLVFAGYGSANADFGTAAREYCQPEWGLTNNAAMLIGNRALSRGCDLGGRVFMHDYDPEADEDGNVLTTIFGGPVVVASWINLQYFASVTAPDTYGAGNKLLHSVIGGNMGVIEGDGSDLRIGLPWQSVHDGTNWRHEPMRLTVLIDAPQERIDLALERTPALATLVKNQWLSMTSLQLIKRTRGASFASAQLTVAG
jgi:uncharacterized protein YbcC (UPF0753/DUF2309 family)